MRIRTGVVTLTLALASLLWSTSASAQTHVVDPAAMQQAITNQTQTDQQNRDVVLGVLRQAQVRDLAGRLGLNVTSAEHAVATLNSAELASLAGPARQASVDLAGGDVIVISVTTLLLLVIIIILIAR